MDLKKLEEDSYWVAIQSNTLFAAKKVSLRKLEINKRQVFFGLALVL